MLFQLRSEKAPPEKVAGVEVRFLHEQGCMACPLRLIEENQHPDMPASGAKRPLVYILGEAPGRVEDEKGRQFIGKSGQLLRKCIPSEYEGRIRYNNVVRTRPLNNATPDRVAVECCRPSVQADIEKTQPKVIIAAGGVAMKWLIGQGKILNEEGKFIPVTVGQHKCWMVSIRHPAYVLRQNDRDENAKYRRTIRKIFSQIEEMDEAEPEDVKRIRDGIEYEVGSDDPTRAVRWFEYMSQVDCVGVDIENASDERLNDRKMRPYGKNARILTVAMSDGKKTYAVAIDHRGAQWTRSAYREVMRAFYQFLISPNAKVGHNSAHELEWMAYFLGFEIAKACVWHDTMAIGVVLGRKRGTFSLDDMVMDEYGFPLKAQSHMDLSRLDDYDVRDVLEYNGLDAKYTYKLRRRLRRQMDKRQRAAYLELIRRTATVVLSQIKGMRIDFDEVERWNRKLEKQLDREREKIKSMREVVKWERKYGPLEISSPEEVAKVIRYITGDYEITGSDESVLKTIDHPFATRILQWRKAAKLRSTYCLPFREGTGKHVWPDGKIHTKFTVLWVRSGRLSSQDPNMQNWPARSNKEIRSEIRASKGKIFLAIDFGQIEACVFAMVSKDKVLVDQLWTGYDIHTDWTRKLGETCPQIIGGDGNLDNPETFAALRKIIKNKWTFPLFFLSVLESVAADLGVRPGEIGHHYDDFWDQYSGVKQWQDDTKEFYEEHGYVETLTGRRRYGPMEITEAINTPIQGTAADIYLDAMNRLSDYAYKTGDWTFQPVVNIHDDLTYEIPDDEQSIEWYENKIARKMLRCPFDFINVPISVETSIGNPWHVLKKRAVYKNDWKTITRKV